MNVSQLRALRATPLSVKTPDEFLQMDAEYQALAKHLMLVHTEGEITGADDYTRIFYKLAPNAYEMQVCCERAAEEVHHYMLGAEVLQGIGVDTSFMLAQDMMERPYYPNELVRGVETWMERALFSFLGEAVVLDHLYEFAESSYAPFAEIFTKTIIKDELVHVAHGRRIVRHACYSPAGRELVQIALNRFWPIVLDLFGRSDSRRSKAYVEWGLRKTTNAELRDAFILKTKPLLRDLGLTVPDDLKSRQFV
jgi:ring-1,2-phenylacetyl-CoA epoxidase subunit PaaA